jgi:hypothetical protein
VVVVFGGCGDVVFGGVEGVTWRCGVAVLMQW